MTLHDYLRSIGETDREFATRAGCKRAYITLLRLGKRRCPSIDIALRIAKASGGKVPVEIWGAT